jgi:hypothetical protein
MIVFMSSQPLIHDILWGQPRAVEAIQSYVLELEP